MLLLLGIVAFTYFCHCFSRSPKEKTTATEFVFDLLLIMVIAVPVVWMGKSGMDVLLLAVGILVCSTYLLGGIEDKKKRMIFLAVGLTVAAIYWCVVICFYGKKAVADPADRITDRIVASVESYGNKIVNKYQQDSSWQEFLEQNKAILQADQSTQNNLQAPNKADLSNQPDTPVASKDNSSTPVEATASGSKDLVKQTAVYIDKTVKKADEYLSETPKAAQKRTKLQNKLKKANSFLKSVQKLTNDIAK